MEIPRMRGYVAVGMLLLGGRKKRRWGYVAVAVGMLLLVGSKKENKMECVFLCVCLQTAKEEDYGSMV